MFTKASSLQLQGDSLQLVCAIVTARTDSKAGECLQELQGGLNQKVCSCTAELTVHCTESAGLLTNPAFMSL